ncbi:hypothetical protein [Undibacterium sp.]
MSFIQWVIIATGEIKRTREAIDTQTAIKLVNWLNTPNSAAKYIVLSV